MVVCVSSCLVYEIGPQQNVPLKDITMRDRTLVADLGQLYSFFSLSLSFPYSSLSFYMYVWTVNRPDNL